MDIVNDRTSLTTEPSRRCLKNIDSQSTKLNYELHELSQQQEQQTDRLFNNDDNSNNSNNNSNSSNNDSSTSVPDRPFIKKFLIRENFSVTKKQHNHFFYGNPLMFWLCLLLLVMVTVFVFSFLTFPWFTIRDWLYADLHATWTIFTGGTVTIALSSITTCSNLPGYSCMSTRQPFVQKQDTYFFNGGSLCCIGFLLWVGLQITFPWKKITWNHDDDDNVDALLTSNYFQSFKVHLDKSIKVTKVVLCCWFLIAFYNCSYMLSILPDDVLSDSIFPTTGVYCCVFIMVSIILQCWHFQRYYQYHRQRNVEKNKIRDDFLRQITLVVPTTTTTTTMSNDNNDNNNNNKFIVLLKLRGMVHQQIQMADVFVEFDSAAHFEETIAKNDPLFRKQWSFFGFVLGASWVQVISVLTPQDAQFHAPNISFTTTTTHTHHHDDIIFVFPDDKSMQ
jgi:hypothetical protein